MTSITIITIVVVALLTLLIFGLSWLAWSSCLKTYQAEIDQGKHDAELCKPRNRKGELLGLIGSWAVLLSLLALFVTGIVYRASGENFTINNQTSLVIKSGSMSDFYDDARAQEYDYDRSLQFDVGDICTFELVADDAQLVVNDVYGYKYKNIIITHRLISTEGGLHFRGDNNRYGDAAVAREAVIYHYTGNKVPGIGSFILFAQSPFGIWSLAGVVGVAVSSEIVGYKLTKIGEKRKQQLKGVKK